jgi:hypothetical protein
MKPWRKSAPWSYEKNIFWRTMLHEIMKKNLLKDHAAWNYEKNIFWRTMRHEIMKKIIFWRTLHHEVSLVDWLVRPQKRSKQSLSPNAVQFSGTLKLSEHNGKCFSTRNTVRHLTSKKADKRLQDSTTRMSAFLQFSCYVKPITGKQCYQYILRKPL